MSISRRDALLGATAAAAVTGLTVAPLAMKAAGVKAALTAEPTRVQPVEPLLAMEQEWATFRDYCNSYPDESDAAVNPLFERLTEMERQIYVTPAATLEGVVVKLRLWSSYYAEFSSHEGFEDSWWRGDYGPEYMDVLGFANVMRDLERLAGGSPS